MSIGIRKRSKVGLSGTSEVATDTKLHCDCLFGIEQGRSIRSRNAISSVPRLVINHLTSRARRLTPAKKKIDKIKKSHCLLNSPHTCRDAPPTPRCHDPYPPILSQQAVYVPLQTIPAGSSYTAPQITLDKTPRRSTRSRSVLLTKRPHLTITICTGTRGCDNSILAICRLNP